MPTPEQNRFWNDYPWVAEGDEWQDQAQHSRQPYQLWKAALIDTFIRPYVAAARVIEIGAGHGRWSEHIIALGAASLHLVELAENSLAYLRNKFAGKPVSTHKTAGSDLGVHPGTTDFIFSYDSLVHCEWPEIQGYITESARALSSQGVMVIHTPGGGTLGGHRGNVHSAQVVAAVQAAGLKLVNQTASWGVDHQHTCSLFGDVVTTAAKP